ncbi:MAG TPA: hypothetical protein VHB79_10905 [Polyangiaceae bacterium]|nr:hypothetical protein [Polyangiaceae bacterium]
MLQQLRRPLQLSFFLSTLVAASVVSQAAFESRVWAAEKANVAVGGFEGAKSDEVRTAFIEALKKDGHYEVTDAEDIKPSAKGKAIAESAKGLAVNFVITGKVGKGFNLKLKVMDAKGKVLDEAEIKGGALPKLQSAVEGTGAASVADALGQPKPEVKAEAEAKKDEAPAEAEDKGDEEKPAEASADTGGDTSSQGNEQTPLEIMAGLRPLHRTFTFHDTIADVRPNQGFRQLLKYELPLGPVIFADLNIWPGSFLTKGVAEWFGLTGGFEKGFATQSVYAEGKPEETTLRTNYSQWYIGGRARIPLGAHLLGANLMYGQQTFALEGDEGYPGQKTGPLVPDVRYSYLRVGLEGTLRFGDFWAGARVGKRFVSSTGALQTVWFPTVKTSSLDAGITAGYRLVSMLDLVVGFDWLRYAFDFNPVPPRPNYESYVAGGAVDEYISGSIAFRFHLPGALDGAASESGGQ